MSLTDRFSALLLATLGLTLIGFSTALFVLSRIYLDLRFDDRLSATLTLLGASVDPKPGWVRWEPKKRFLPPSHWDGRHATTWLVFDGEGRLLTSPKDLPVAQLTRAWVPRSGGGALPDRVTDRRGRSWRVAQRLVVPSSVRGPGTVRPADTPDGKSYHATVLLAAFGSLDENEATLAMLGWFLIGIGTLIWALAALCARWLSRKTLVPLTRLVASARDLDASRPGWSLPVAGTRDELDELGHAFNGLLARLHEAYDRQRRFSGEASHQLRTPVAVMIGHLEVAQRHERSGEQYRRVIHLAHKRAVELGQIVESLLFLSRADSTTLVQAEALDLGRWLSEHMAARPEDVRSGDMIVIVPSNVPLPLPLWIKAQPHLLGQLVENLLDNACKYSRPGTPIVVAAARGEGSGLLSVEDSGCGIAREDLPRVFEPFFRSSRTSPGRVSGVGLGLSVVERIAHAFGGTVAVRSEAGRGSRFEVSLPLTTPPDRGQDLNPGGPIPSPRSRRNPLLSHQTRVARAPHPGSNPTPLRVFGGE